MRYASTAHATHSTAQPAMPSPAKSLARHLHSWYKRYGTCDVSYALFFCVFDFGLRLTCPNELSSTGMAGRRPHMPTRDVSTGQRVAGA
eukprot:3940254-Rhodomonas_salina.2